ncbi:unknownprotein [Zostera marina]|uniref:Uncharacterized protein n=1 Tax=Zostera marina TaxID=29655 RepID=A0A0K9PV85_ZOSMR|nr:unknownprotein [Zostera marina]
MATISINLVNSVVIHRISSPGYISRQFEQPSLNLITKSFFATPMQWKTNFFPYKNNNTRVTICAAFRENRRSSNSAIFVGGFVLGGLIMVALGCVYAPQISKAMSQGKTESKDLMKKLPKFIYDEEKVLEKRRNVLSDKIAQLNSAIDEASSQLQDNDESKNGAPITTDNGIEASA